MLYYCSTDPHGDLDLGKLKPKHSEEGKLLKEDPTVKEMLKETENNIIKDKMCILHERLDEVSRTGKSKCQELLGVYTNKVNNKSLRIGKKKVTDDLRKKAKWREGSMQGEST